MKTLSNILLIFVLLPTLAGATDYYVDANIGSNTTGDGSQSKSWKTISFALARISGTGHTVHVAAGTYDTVMDGIWYEVFPLLMKNGVSLVGAGANSTILDADSTGGVIRCVGIADTITRIEGFTIRSGWAREGEGNGGGIYCSASSVLIINNIIQNNRAKNSGGGIYWGSGAKARIRYNRIASNNAGEFSSSGGGGGVYVSLSGTNTSVEVIGDTIRGNYFGGTYGGGGGVYLNAKSMVVSNNDVSNNNSFWEDGAGIYLSGATSALVSSNKISNNYTTYGNGVGIYISGSTSVLVLNNEISNNKASTYSGGGLYWISSSGQISSNRFWGNVCDDDGGGAYFSSSSSVEFIKNAIYDNKAGNGGGIYCSNSSQKIINNTMDGNRTSSGGGAIHLVSSSPEIVNNILSNNERYAIYEADANSDPPTRYNDFWGNNLGLYFDEGIRGFTSVTMLENFVPEAHHNLAADPLFVDRTGKDYHLQSISPCIDAGDPTSPLDPDNTRADIGAFYYPHDGDKIPPPAPQNLTASGANPSPWQNTSSFSINWTNPADPSGIARAYYKLGTAPTSNSDTTGSKPGTPPFTVTATQQGGQSLYVWLKDSANNVNYQNNASVNLRYENTIPTTPMLLAPLNNSATNNPKPMFDWSDATDAGGSGLSGYEIQVDNNANFSSPEYSTLVTSSTATPANNLADGAYSWRVRAKDGANNVGSWSTVWILQIDTQAPARITNLSIAATTTSSITLSWTAPGDDGNVGTASQYDLRYSTTAPGSDTTAWWNAATQVSGEPTPKAAGSTEVFTVSGLASNTTYYFSLKAADEALNWSKVSRVVAGKTTSGDITPPPAPINLVANGANPSPWKNTPAFIISWTNPSDPSGIARALYKRGAAPTSNTDTTGSASGTPPFNLNATQQAGQLLYVWLKDGAGNVNYQNHASVNLRYDGTAPSVPVLVSPLNSASTNNPKPVFDWNEATDTGGSGMAEYEIQVDNNADFSSPEFSATLSSSSAAPTNNLAHGTYSWRVRAKDTASNISNWSSLWLLQIDTQPPAKINNLTVGSTTSSSITLNWTAPGDDGNSGIAAQYDLRFTTTAPGSDTTGWWNSATSVSGVPAPKSAGTAESFTVSGLPPNTTYYLALKTADEASNWSAVSKIANGTTQPGTDGPHFKFKPNTNSSYSIVVDAATIDGNSLQPDDEIGVFTPAGLCVGASIWDGKTPLPLTAWEDDNQTPEVDGYKIGEKMYFRFWDVSATLEYPATPAYSRGDGTFGNGAYARISRLEARTSGQYLVYIQDTTGTVGSHVQIPVLVNNITGAGIISVALIVETDTSVLIPVSVFATGALTAGWGAPTFNALGGKVHIAMSDATALSGAGPLVVIKYFVNPQASVVKNTIIHLAKVMFNEGEPPAITQDGAFTVTGGFKISGVINYYSNNSPINNAIVSLMTKSTIADTTDATGQYDFSSVLSGNYTSRPGKKKDLAVSISPYDAALILQYVVGLRTFTPYQMLAADVSDNGEVTAHDAALILRYYVKLIAGFPAMPDSLHFWTFVPKNYPIDNANWSKAPDSLRYEPLNSDKLDQNFVGIIYGDPSGNWNPSGNILASGKAAERSITFRLGEVNPIDDKIISIPIEAGEGSELVSVGIELEYDSGIVKILDVAPGDITADYTMAHHISAGQIRIALAGNTPLYRKGTLVNVVAEILDPAKKMILPIALTEVICNEHEFTANVQNSAINLESAVPEEFVLYQNYPNPFNPETTIKYQLPASGKVVLRVFNLSGQEIRTLVDELKEAGCYEVLWDGRDSYGRKMTSGIYVYQLQVNDLIQSKKMAMLK